MRKTILSVAVALAMLAAMFIGGTAVTAEDLIEPIEGRPDAPVTYEEVDGELAPPDQDYYGMDDGLDEVLRENESSLKSIQGVISVMGMDMDGVPTIVVFVEEGTDTGPIPEEIDGYPVYVEEDAEVTIMPYTDDDGIAEDNATEEVPETTEEDEDESEATDYTLFIYIAIAVVVVVLIVVLISRKK